MNNKSSKSTPGMFLLVLHTHLPWLAHNGVWPLGEEWLYQAWANSYLPTFALLNKFAEQGRKSILTLSITPVLAAQLNDSYCLKNMYSWLGNWQLRALEAQQLQLPNAKLQFQEAKIATNLFETFWKNGVTKLIQSLVTSETIELLAGPINHTFQPLLPPDLRNILLKYGLQHLKETFQLSPTGIWAPECAYTPTLEKEYQTMNLDHFLVDGPAFQHETGLIRPVGDTSVLAFARNLKLSYEVWSPTAGYPGNAYYRDFYAVDKRTGLKLSRVTDKALPTDKKLPYDRQQAEYQTKLDAHRFAAQIEETLHKEFEKLGRPGIAVAAFDTELFGHWWHEGPEWLNSLFDILEERGINYGTMQQAIDQGYVGKNIIMSANSWGLGKDWRIWQGERVGFVKKLQEQSIGLATQAAKHIAIEVNHQPNMLGDTIFNELALQLSSDWAFMISHNSATEYAFNRINQHATNVQELTALVKENNLYPNLLKKYTDNIFSPYFDYRDLLGSNL